jgi:hypothetical protein
MVRRWVTLIHNDRLFCFFYAGMQLSPRLDLVGTFGDLRQQL